MVKQSLCNALHLVDMSVFLGSHRSVESADPQFTMRRKMEQLREELELMEQLRHVWQPAFTLSHHVHSAPFVCVLWTGRWLCHCTTVAFTLRTIWRSNKVQTAFLCFKTCSALLIIRLASATPFLIFSSEHREPAEADRPWGPGTVSDGRSCALPPRQPHSPPFSCRHPRSLACRGRSHSVCADDERLPHPSVFSHPDATALPSPSSAWPSVGEMWRTSWRPAGKSG